MEKIYNYKKSFESGTRIAIRNQTGTRSGLALNRGLQLTFRDEQLLLLLLGGH